MGEGRRVPGLRRAIHVRTGNPASGDDLTAWLIRESVATTVCRDAFDTCAIMTRARAAAPDVAFVGLDWLPADELAILHHIRETWPGVSMVAYSHVHTEIALGLPRTLALHSRDEIEQVIAGRFEQLLERLRGLGSMRISSGSQPAARPGAGTTAYSNRGGLRSGAEESELRGRFQADPPPTHAPQPLEPPQDLPRRPGIVTREEFESLMKDVGI